MKPALRMCVLGACVLGFMLSAVKIVPAEEKTAARSLEPVLEAQVDRSTITIGDPVHYTLSLRRPPKSKLISVLQIPRSSDFEISKVEDFKRTEDGWGVEGKKVTLTSFRLGEFVLDSMHAEVLLSDGKSKTISSPKIYITVISTQNKGTSSKDILGIKNVVDIPLRFIKKYALPLGISFLVLIAVLLIMRRFKKAKQEGVEIRDVLSPEDEAFRELHTLFDSSLLKQGKSKEYFFRLSEVLRIYFEKRYMIFAVEATTSEILRLLRQKEVPSDLLSKTQEVLETSDLAKFAKWKPEPLEVLEINKKAEAVIKKAAGQPEN